MSTLVSEITTSNPILTRLKHALDAQSSSCDWLVLAHNDPVMLRAVSDAMGGDSATTFPTTHDELDDAEWLGDAIAWASETDGFKKLLIVGSSDVCEPTSSGGGAIVNSEMQQEPTQSNYDRLVNNAAAVHRNLEEAKKSFASQVRGLCENATLGAALRHGLQVHALFYVCQSGAFLKLDVEKGTYELLHASS